VDIISMSFGLSENNTAIKHAIDHAEQNGTILFAPASTDGVNMSRPFPANLGNVICIHATDGLGDPAPINPSPLQRKDNFATLGMGISSSWNGDEVFLSGTSFATPVAAGIAANILAFIDHQADDGNINESQRRNAHSCAGMREIFGAISVSRSGYDFVAPWTSWWKDGATVEMICAKMRDTLG
jgi:subtilisin family serine protease